MACRIHPVPVILAAILFPAAAWAQPANNSCGSATPVPLGGAVRGSVAGATGTGFGNNCGTTTSHPDVWHSVYVPCEGDLTVYTCPVDFDSSIALHSNCPYLDNGFPPFWYTYQLQ